MSEIKYSYQLDGVRAFCIIITVLCHIEGVPSWINGSVGVDIFFALSGFIITRILFAEYERSGRISISSFYVRRFFRIAPLYFIAFSLTAIASIVLYQLNVDPSKYQKLLVSWPWIVSFNRELCPTNVCGDAYFGHAWTIGVEEKFYIVWPIIFGWLVTWRKPSVISFFLLSAIILMTLDSKFARGYIGILFGCLVSYVDVKLGIKMTRSFAIIISALLAAGYSISLTGSHYGNLMISFSSAWLILMLFRARTGFFVTLFSAKPIAWVGGLTYGIYLFHVLAINLVEYTMQYFGLNGYNWRWMSDFLFSYIISICLAHFFGQLIEVPMINFGRRVSARLASK